jgi:predicted nucleic acid-binding protein
MMKVFLDTNVFLEYFEQRRECQAVGQLLSAVEDSFQYQCGLQAKCDALVTINLRDYNNADTSKMVIMSPTEFVEKYLL